MDITPDAKHALTVQSSRAAPAIDGTELVELERGARVILTRPPRPRRTAVVIA